MVAVDMCLPGSPKERKMQHRWMQRNGPTVGLGLIATLFVLYMLFGGSSSDVKVTPLQFTQPDVQRTGPDFGGEPEVPSDTDSDVKLGMAIVSDEDEDNKGHDVTTDQRLHKSHLCHGHLSRKRGRYSVQFSKQQCERITSKITFAGRGFELSELVRFSGKLLAPDDRTGFLYDLSGPNPLPWIYLPVAPHDASPMKAEWATVKNGMLYVGGNGKEYCRKRTKPPKFDWIDHNEDEWLSKAELKWYERRLMNSLILTPVEHADLFKAPHSHD